MAKSSTRRVTIYINGKEVVRLETSNYKTTEMKEKIIMPSKNTCRHAQYAEKHPVQPLKGPVEARAAAVSYRAVVPAGHAGCGVSPSYRALSPRGETLPFRISAPYSVIPQYTDHCSLITDPWSFTFSAKEKDPETGLSYFGSRYYSSDLSVWLSVDPMGDKYASLSPYTYCANNPVRCVDPNGASYRKFEDYDNGSYLGEIDDGVDETVRITASHYQQLQNYYNTDKQNNDDNLTSYNEMIDRYSIGKVGYSIAQTALKYEGSYAWAYDVKKGNFSKNSYKCNKFVYDVLSENGVEPPGKWPPQASAWAGNGYIKGWEKVSQPNVGDIVAGAFNYTDATGHVVIVTGINLSTGEISVMGTVNSSYIGDNGFGNDMVNNNGWHDRKHYSPGIRRFVGKQQ